MKIDEVELRVIRVPFRSAFTTSFGSQTEKHTVIVTVSDGTLQDTKTLTIIVTATTPTLTLSATPTSVSPGGSSTLRWAAANATSCVSGSGASRPLEGSFVVVPLVTTGYSLTCTGPGGTVTKTVTVTVTVVPAPTLEFTVTPATAIFNGPLGVSRASVSPVRT